MSISTQKIEDFIINSKMYLVNAQKDDYVRAQIPSVGYDTARMEEGSALQQQAFEARQTQLQWRNISKSLHSAMNELFKTSFTNYMDDLRLFRSAFLRNEAVAKKLGLPGERKRSVSGFLEQAQVLYGTVLREPKLLTEVEKFNLTEPIVQAKLAEVAAVEDAYQKAKNAEKSAQDATDALKKLLQKLKDWVREFQNACRIVLKEKPQLLEKVGVQVRSSKRPKPASTGGDPDTPPEPEPPVGNEPEEVVDGDVVPGTGGTDTEPIVIEPEPTPPALNNGRKAKEG